MTGQEVLHIRTRKNTQLIYGTPICDPLVSHITHLLASWELELCSPEGLDGGCLVVILSPN